MMMDARTGLGRFRDFRISNYALMMDLIKYCRDHSIEQILALPDVQARFKADALEPAHLGPQAQARENLDGLGLAFGDWRFNLRSSNTEPLLRLNVESRGRADLVESAVAELSALIG